MKHRRYFRLIKYYIYKSKKKCLKLDQQGQALMEFLLLFFVLITISISLLGGINKFIGTRWTAMIEVIASPPEQRLNLR